MDPLIRYIKEGEMPEARQERKKLRYRAAKFTVIGDTLYKKGFFLSP